MKRFVSIFGAVFIAFVLFVPAALAADPIPHTGRVIVSTGGDVTLPAGEHADLVVVVNGTATIHGEVNAIVAIDGAANLAGARTETIVAIRSPIEIGAGSVVNGDVKTFDSIVHQTGDARIQGQISNLEAELSAIGVFLGPAIVLLWLGFGLATLVAGLLLAGLASRQVREAETLISREPMLTLIAGIVGVIVIPLVAFLLMATLVGAPLGVGILLEVLPLAAFIGYLVAGVWVGDWVLRRTTPEHGRERPYLAAIVGLLILQVLALVPILAIVGMIASLFGFGAVIRLALRKLRSRSMKQPMAPGPMPAPIAG
jgi:hypothetical protein